MQREDTVGVLKMKNKSIVLQIFSGGFNENKITFEAIEQKLRNILEKIDADKIIIGWSTKKEIYIKIKELLKDYDTELYLWIPVFSEIGILKDAVPSIDFKGEKVGSYALQEGENFQFYCPTDKKNIQRFIEIYEENFDDIGFDGVFLDKIRYGSFSNGIDAVFSCFCTKCKELYKEKSLDLEALKKEINELKAGKENYNKIPFNITGYNKGVYEFKNSIWGGFFRLKSEIIYDTLLILKDYFSSKNMKIGIDTFSPFLAYFVGQDLYKLQNIADFIKPMMYRITQAPAGLPFECDNLIKESIRGDLNEAKKRYLKIINSEMYNDRFPIKFVKNELEFMTASLKSDVYAGIEVNRKEPIANVYPEYIKENLENLNDTNIKGYVLSWDILSAPDENIHEITNYFCRRG